MNTHHRWLRASDASPLGLAFVFGAQRRTARGRLHALAVLAKGLTGAQPGKNLARAA
jgi:hypothetical protein